MTERPRTDDRFGFDSRKEKFKDGDESHCVYPDGIPSDCIARVKVPCDPSFGCEPSRITVVAMLADGAFISLPIIRVPVKLISARISHHPMLQPAGEEGFLVSITPTEDDLSKHDGSPYREEGKIEELPPKEKEEIFKTMSSFDVSNWTPFDVWNHLYLTFENVIREHVHIFGYVEGYALKSPDDMRG